MRTKLAGQSVPLSPGPAIFPPVAKAGIGPARTAAIRRRAKTCPPKLECVRKTGKRLSGNDARRDKNLKPAFDFVESG